MKTNKKQIVISLISIAIILVSLAVTICDFAIPINLWIHPALTFLFCMAIGFGVLCFALGLTKKSAWYFFLSAIPFAFAIIYPLACVGLWWIGLIVVFVVWAVTALVCYMWVGFTTEDISLNKSSDYKNYEVRKAEKEKAEAQKEPEELPEIKSFK